jgi:KaiC/GvpD/RAD55 family RecA-like ATPase
MPKEQMLKTYLPHLDEALGGGIRRGRAIGIYGSLGVGKTILSMQIAYNNISRGYNCSFHTHDQSSEMLISKMTNFGWDPTPYMEHFHILDRYSEIALSEDDLTGSHVSDIDMVLSQKLDLKPLLNRTIKGINEYFDGPPDVIIMDSATPYLMQLGGLKLYLLFQICKKLFFNNSANLVTCHSEVTDEKTINSLKSLSDYFFHLYKENSSYKLNIEKSIDWVESRSFQYSISGEGIDLSKISSIPTRM